MTGEVARTARCCCGALTVSILGAPKLHGICHCDDCKRRTGSAFGQSVYVDLSQVRAIDGEVRCYRIEGDAPQQRFFCTRCGTTLYWKSAHFPGMLGIAAGGFAGTDLPPPTVSLSNDGRCFWLTGIDGLATTLTPG